MGKDRKSSFEVLGIISMVGIVFDYLSLHGLSVLSIPNVVKLNGDDIF